MRSLQNADEILCEGTVHDISQWQGTMQGDVLDNLDIGMQIMLDIILQKVERKEDYFLFYDQRLGELRRYMVKRRRNGNVQCIKKLRAMIFYYKLKWKAMQGESGNLNVSRQEWCLTDWMVGRSLQSRVLLNDYVMSLTYRRPTLLNLIRFTNGDTLLHNLLRFSTYDKVCILNNVTVSGRLRISSVCHSLKMLLRNHCDPNCLNFDKETPLHILLLTMKNMDILLNSTYLNTGYWYQSPARLTSVLYSPIVEASLVILKALLSAGADPSIPLILANRCPTPLCLLIDNWYLYTWQEPLHLGFYHAVRQLCKRGADVNNIQVAHKTRSHRVSAKPETAFTYFIMTVCGMSGGQTSMLSDFIIRLLNLFKSHGLDMNVTSGQCLLHLLSLAHTMNDLTIPMSCFLNGIDPNKALHHTNNINLKKMYNLVRTGANANRWLPIFSLLSNSLNQMNLLMFCQMLEQCVGDMKSRLPLLDWAVYVQSTPLHLRVICRKVIYESLEWDIATKAKSLPLPTKLIQYVMQMHGE